MRASPESIPLRAPYLAKAPAPTLAARAGPSATSVHRLFAPYDGQSTRTQPRAIPPDGSARFLALTPTRPCTPKWRSPSSSQTDAHGKGVAVLRGRQPAWAEQDLRPRSLLRYSDEHLDRMGR